MSIQVVLDRRAAHGANCRKRVFEHGRVPEALGTESIGNDKAGYTGFGEELRVALALMCGKPVVPAPGQNNQPQALRVLLGYPACYGWRRVCLTRYQLAPYGIHLLFLFIGRCLDGFHQISPAEAQGLAIPGRDAEGSRCKPAIEIDRTLLAFGHLFCVFFNALIQSLFKALLVGIGLFIFLLDQGGHDGFACRCRSFLETY